MCPQPTHLAVRRKFRWKSEIQSTAQYTLTNGTQKGSVKKWFTYVSLENIRTVYACVTMKSRRKQNRHTAKMAHHPASIHPYMYIHIIDCYSSKPINSLTEETCKQVSSRSTGLLGYYASPPHWVSTSGHSLSLSFPLFTNGTKDVCTVKTLKIKNVVNFSELVTPSQNPTAECQMWTSDSGIHNFLESEVGVRHQS